MIVYSARQLGGEGTCLNNHGDVGGSNGQIWFGDGRFFDAGRPLGITAINDSQVAVGGSASSSGPELIYSPFMVTRDRAIIDMSGVAAARDETTIFTGINNNGWICGNRQPGFAGTTAFVIGPSPNDNPNYLVYANLLPFPGDGSIIPTSINDAGEVVAISGSNQEQEACLYRVRSDEPLPPPIPIPASENVTNPRINARGQVIAEGGSSIIMAWNTRTNPPTNPPTFSGVPLPDGSVGGNALAINDFGVIVGECWMVEDDDDFGAPRFSFIYDPTTSRSILLGNLIPPGLGQESPIAINNVGQILIGSFESPSVLLTPLRPNLSSLNSIFAQILNGVTADSGGLELLGGRVVPVPPRDNGSGLEALAPGVRDALIGLAINQVAAQIVDTAGRSAVGRAGLELAHASVARMLATPAPVAPKPGRARLRSPLSRFAAIRGTKQPEPKLE